MANAQQPSTQSIPELANAGNGNATAAVAAEDVWDEERLEKAMKTLKEMHIQLRGLRATIPRLIAPLTILQPSPEVLFREFSKAANTANKEVQEFRQLMTDEESTKVFDQARKSRAEKPKNIKPWRVSEHPDWLTRDK